MSADDSTALPRGQGAGEAEPQLFPVLDGYWDALQRGQAGDRKPWLGQHPEGSQGLRDLRLLEALHDARRVLGEDAGQLLDRDGLWPLLVLLTARNVLPLPRHEHGPGRDAGHAPGAEALAGAGPAAGEPTATDLVGPDQEPEFAAQVAEECRRLLDLLADPELQSVALWKVAGCTNQEIAARLGRAAPAVERKLRAIRTVWEKGGRS